MSEGLTSQAKGGGATGGCTPTDYPLRNRVAELLAKQEAWPEEAVPRLELVFGGSAASDSEDLHHVTLRIGGELRKYLTAAEVERLFLTRKKTIAQEKADPYNFGYEPPMWAAVDWLIVQLRVEHPGEVIEVVILGGNRAGKTDYAAKRMCEVLDCNADWVVWAFHTDQSSSRGVQQKRFWKYLPLDCKPDSGKTRKTLNARMNYSKLTGFTENCFALSNGAQCVFKFYSGNSDSLEGDEPEVVWSDERMPISWIKAVGIRLLTKAGRTHGLASQLRPLWEAHVENMKRGMMDTVPKALRTRMWLGVHLVTFTPLDGLTPAVASFINNSRTLASQKAPMLPITGPDNQVAGHAYLPRVKRQPNQPSGAVWMWNEDNKHGGNYQGMIKKSAKERWSDAEKKIKFYGYTEKTIKSLFAKFDVDIHVVPAKALPKEGTWYHIVDPCNGRNWFMLWVLVDPRGTAWVAYEWPPVKDYVPGVGTMGEWVKDTEGKKFDGDAGPAQEPLGWGCKRYRDEIHRIEAKLWAMQAAAPRANVPDGTRVNGVVKHKMVSWLPERNGTEPSGPPVSPASFPNGLHKCTHPACDRLVSAKSMYCCTACSLAHERGYETHEGGELGHSEDCNCRHKERGSARVIAEPVARVSTKPSDREDAPITGEENRITVQRRIMDSRYGATPNATTEGNTETIMEMMRKLGMRFHPSGQTLAADGENKSRVSEGIQAINDMLDFDADLATRDEVTGRLVPDPAQAPKMYVLEHCENVIWCGLNYTGLDGQHGAGKDVVDPWRYFAIGGARYIPPVDESYDGGGWGGY